MCYRQFEDTSYPYAKYAAEFGVPYGDVLRAVEAIERGECVTGLPSRIMADIAHLVQRERDKRCASAESLPLFGVNKHRR